MPRESITHLSTKQLSHSFYRPQTSLIHTDYKLRKVSFFACLQQAIIPNFMEQFCSMTNLFEVAIVDLKVDED